MSVILTSEAAAYLRIYGGSGIDESVLSGLIDTAEAVIAERVGPLTQTTKTSVVSGGPVLALPYWPVSAVTSVVADGVTYATSATAGVGGVVTVTGLSAGTYTVTYTAGWPAGQLPAPIRTAVLEMVRHLWKPQRGTVGRPVDDGPAPGYLIPNRVRELLEPYLMPGFA